MTTTTEGPHYEHFLRDGSWNNTREILVGEKAVNTFTEIPVVDVSGIFSPDSQVRLHTAQEVADVCKSVGFMYIKGHGISQELIDDVFDLSRKYHAQPLEVKKEELAYLSPTLRGYDIHYTKTPNGPAGEKTATGQLHGQPR